MADQSQKHRRGTRRKPDGSRLKKSRKEIAGSTKAKSRLEVIERLLHNPVEVMKNGRPAKMATLGAIMFQLVQKSLAGDRKADRVQQRFESHALENSASEFEIVFVENDYTKAFAASQGDDV